MPSKRIGIVLPPMPCSDFITYILNRHKEPTTLLICSTKDSFLKDLLSTAHASQPEEPAQTSEISATQHYLFNSTINLVAKSSSVNIVFVPTLPHLRAYLATYSMPSETASSVAVNNDSGHLAAFLGIWGLVHLHRSTAEYSAQGLSRTIASAVESLSFGKQQLVLAEYRGTPEGGELESADMSDMTSANPWKDQVPLLSGSIRYGGEERNLAGNTTTIESIVAKWCRFKSFDQDSHAI